MKILIIADYIGENVLGGAGRSLNDIINFLIKPHKLDFLEQIQSEFLKLFGLDYYVNYLRIKRKVRKFKPDVILTQLRISFPSIRYANKKKIPIINFIHDVSDLCPKYTDIIDYGRSCCLYLDKDSCFGCIDRWDKLSQKIGGKKRTKLSKFFYKYRYYLCKRNQKILMESKFNFVPSELIQDKILPIESRVFNLNFFEDVDVDEKGYTMENRIIFVVPEYNDFHKGSDFVRKLSDEFPDTLFVIVGKTDCEYFGKYLNCINIGKSSKECLYSLFKHSRLTIVPSFMTESFGRVVVESLLQGTPVICSDNVGVGYEKIFRKEEKVFKTKEYMRMLPIELELWKKTIQGMLDKNIRVPKEEIERLKKYFSKRISRLDLEFVLGMLYYTKTKMWT